MLFTEIDYIFLITTITSINLTLVIFFEIVMVQRGLQPYMVSENGGVSRL